MNAPLALALLAAAASGAFSALQAPTNALLARGVNSPLNAALVSFAVGTAILGVLALVLGVKPSGEAVRELPWYVWMGGLYGAFFVTAGAFAAPVLGMAYLFAVLVAGQLAMALLLDHYGAFGLDAEPITPVRLMGVLLILSGVFLVRR
jgi:transporter family-2 protein